MHFYPLYALVVFYAPLRIKFSFHLIHWAFSRFLKILWISSQIMIDVCKILQIHILWPGWVSVKWCFRHSRQPADNSRGPHHFGEETDTRTPHHWQFEVCSCIYCKGNMNTYKNYSLRPVVNFLHKKRLVRFFSDLCPFLKIKIVSIFSLTIWKIDRAIPVTIWSASGLDFVSPSATWVKSFIKLTFSQNVLMIQQWNFIHIL